MDIKTRFLLAGAGVMAAAASAGAASAQERARGVRRNPGGRPQPGQCPCPAFLRGPQLRGAPHQQGDRVVGRRPADLYGIWGVGPGVDPYAQGVKMARTYLDAINVEMDMGARFQQPCASSCAGWWTAAPRHRPSHARGVRRDLHHRPGRSLYARQYGRAGTAARFRYPRHPHVPCPRHQGGQVATQSLPLSLRPAWHSQAADAGLAVGAGYAAQCWGVELYEYNICRSVALNPKGS